MYLLKDKALKEKLNQGETEYLLTNGLGGYASNTINEMPMRKYHGILVAALNPPVNRFMSLVRTLEEITVESQSYQLFSSKYNEEESCETDCLKSFRKDAGVHWTYEQNDLFALEKSLYLVQGQNKAILRFKLQSGQKPIQFKMTPEYSIRDHHEVLSASDLPPAWQIDNTEEGLGLKLSSTYNCNSHTPDLDECYSRHLVTNLSLTRPQCDSGSQKPEAFPTWQTKSLNQWSRPYYLSNEVERGLETYTSHYKPLEFILDLKPHTSTVFYLSLEVPLAEGDISENKIVRTESPESLIQREEALYLELLRLSEGRRENLSGSLKSAHEKLSVAANNFIAYRESTGQQTILAGYPWFTDWGRDSMISLCGLTLSAGRPHLFREIYETFEKYMNHGILPNMFPDDGQEPLYNTVDATLWMPIAMNRYLEHTGDHPYVEAHFIKTMRELIEHYQKGTLNNTYMDTDGLIWSGDESTQLTWMDVKVEGWVVTPRHGKAVEINALWYNALMIGAKFESDASLKDRYLEIADKVKQSFNDVFWNESLGYLNDVVRSDEVISLIRPNQLIAISLPYPLLDVEKTQKVLSLVTEKLYFDTGIRSLAQDQPNYKGYYGGNVLARDGAYHRGTGWGWLMGPFMDAVIELSTRQNKNPVELQAQLETILEKAIPHLDELCLGQYAENFDGDAPHHGRGCMAQAWSVAELLRGLDQLNELKKGRRDDE